MTGSLPFAAEAIVSALLLLGAAFALTGSLGLARLEDFYMRLHGPSKSTTLGVGGVLAGSALYFSVRQGEVSMPEILVTAFLFLTTPASAHLLAKAALHLRVPNVSGAPAAARERGRDETAAGAPATPGRDGRPAGPAAPPDVRPG